jgi:hypothetical protein
MQVGYIVPTCYNKITQYFRSRFSMPTPTERWKQSFHGYLIHLLNSSGYQVGGTGWANITGISKGNGT